ncbi:unnamed protein product [Linum trigynum]|uniref:TF-B3 domain-containing protein n=1 Tax=Linum trigynum TaxID=586398 RepID=A0AAV2D2K4_9ROSI
MTRTSRGFNHFIKELCPEAILTKKLMLPRKFVKTVRDELSREVCLEAPNGRIWIIGLTREPGDRNIVWLDSGFGEFLSFYSIGARHSLIFKYRGGSHFQVVVCDNTACEVAYTAEVLPVSFGEEDGSDDPEFDGEEADGEEEEEEEMDGFLSILATQKSLLFWSS